MKVAYKISYRRRAASISIDGDELMYESDIKYWTSGTADNEVQIVFDDEHVIWKVLIFSDIPSSSAEFRLKLRIDIGTFFRLIDVIIKAILYMVTDKFVNRNQIFFLFNI